MPNPLLSLSSWTTKPAGITINSAQFQSLWGRLGGGIESAYDLSKVPRSTEEVEGLLSARGINTMASGDKPAAMKFFFYAKVQINVSGRGVFFSV